MHILRPALHTLKIGAISLGLSSLCVSESIAKTRDSIGEIVYCDLGERNIQKLTEIYTVSSGDTLSNIAEKKWLSYDDILLAFVETYPERDPNKLRIGEEIYILSSDPKNIEVFQWYKEQIRAEQQYNELVDLWENGDIETLQKDYSYTLFPTSPIALGLESFHNTLLNEYKTAPKAYGPRVVDVLYQSAVICANLSRSADRYAFWDKDLLPKNIHKWLYDENIDAWQFTEHYMKVWYSQLFNSREMFYSHMSQSQIPIRRNFREDYKEYLITLQKYLKKNGVPGTKIPVFFLYTWSSASINAHLGWKNPNSHVFAYIWEAINDPFPAEYFMPIHGWVWSEHFKENISVEDYLVYMIQDLWSFRTALSPHSAKLARKNILRYADFIEFYINGEKVDILSELQNPQIKIRSDDMIQYGGSIVFDGLHITTSPDSDLRKNMNMRLLPFWAAFSLDLFYPTELLEPSKEILDYWYTGLEQDKLEQVPILDTFFLKPWDDIQSVILDLIAEHSFWIANFDELSDSEKWVAKHQYYLQSLAQQMYWYQTSWWKSWNAGATKINAPMYYFDTSNVYQIYRDYVQERKREYFQSLEVGCNAWKLVNLPFFEIVFFPGDTTSSILSQLEIQLSLRNPELSKIIKDFDRVSKNKFLKDIFWDEIASGKIPSNKSVFLSYEDISLKLQLFTTVNALDFSLETETGENSLDNTLIELTTSNPTIRYMLRYILASESYIYPCGDCSDFYRDFLWLLPESTIASRRGVKDMLQHIQKWNIDDVLNSLLSSFWKRNIPKINSFWDFQFRLANLYRDDYSPTSLGIQLEKITESILDPQGEYSEVISSLQEKYPEIISKDLNVLKKLHLLLWSYTGSQMQDNIITKEVIENIQALMRLNNGNDSNIIGKILSLQIMRQKLQGHFENIVWQVEMSGWSILDIDNSLAERLILMAVLANNKWENTQLAIMWENFIRRIFNALDSKYPGIRIVDLPKIQRNDDFLKKVRYNRLIFKKNISEYVELLDLYPEDPFIQEFIKILENFKEHDISSTSFVYQLVADKKIQDFLEENSFDTSILPTQEEIQWEDFSWRQLMFSYVNRADKIQARIQKPEIKAQDIVLYFGGVFLSLMYLLSRNIQSYSTALAHKKEREYILRKTINKEKIEKEKWERHKNKEISQIKRTAIKIRKLLVGHEAEIDMYRNSYCEIKWEKWMVEFLPNGNLVLTNDPRHPLSAMYKSGRYLFLSRTEEILRNAYWENFKKWAEENTRDPRPLVLKTEMKIAAE